MPSAAEAGGWHDAAMTSPYARPAPVYVGFADRDPDLYEFRTESGMYVYLHELDCVEIKYLPVERTLRLTFDGGPTDLMPAMTVTLTFTEAEVYQWQSIGEPVAQTVVDTIPRVRGQVTAFGSMKEGPGSAHTGMSFHISLLDVAVSFFARTVVCEAREGVSGAE
jgi:hypothetical protein